MSTPINRLSSATPELSDLIAIWDSANSTPRNTSISMLATLLEGNINCGKPTTQYEAPSLTGFSVSTLDTGVDVHLLLLPSGILATGTIVLPTSAVDKQTVLVTTTKMITAVTVSAATSVIGAPSTLAADDFFTMKYDATTNAWYRVG